MFEWLKLFEFCKSTRRLSRLSAKTLARNSPRQSKMWLVTRPEQVVVRSGFCVGCNKACNGRQAVPEPPSCPVQTSNLGYSAEIDDTAHYSAFGPPCETAPNSECMTTLEGAVELSSDMYTDRTGLLGEHAGFTAEKTASTDPEVRQISSGLILLAPTDHAGLTVTL